MAAQLEQLCERLKHAELAEVLVALAKETGSVDRALQLGAAKFISSGFGNILVPNVVPRGNAPPKPSPKPAPAGIIGMCDDSTFGDCMKAGVIGFTESAAHQFQRLSPGAAAFLYNTKSRVLFGPFKFETILAPYARDFTLWGADNPKYPHQVRGAVRGKRPAVDMRGVCTAGKVQHRPRTVRPRRPGRLRGDRDVGERP